MLPHRCTVDIGVSAAIQMPEHVDGFFLCSPDMPALLLADAAAACGCRLWIPLVTTACGVRARFQQAPQLASRYSLEGDWAAHSEPTDAGRR